MKVRKSAIVSKLSEWIICFDSNFLTAQDSILIWVPSLTIMSNAVDRKGEKMNYATAALLVGVV